MVDDKEELEIELTEQEQNSILAKSIRSGEFILYPENGATIEKLLLIVTEKSVKDYAMILHDKDQGKEHIHLLIWLGAPWPLKAVLKWFEEFKVSVTNYDRICTKNGALAYLTHSNRPQKYQYQLEDVTHSVGIKETLEQATSEALRDREIKLMCDRVALGSMSPRTLYNQLDGVEIRKYRKLIDGSVDARLIKSQTITEKDMKVFYIVGPAGSGKSTLARFLSNNFSPEAPYISSSSNDPLDGYLLEPVIILDDLRGDAFKFADLLKLLDNYVPSTIKCRYKNKAIDAKYMFITSTRRPEELYGSETFAKDDNLDQLKRRIQAVYEIEKGGSILQGQYIWNAKSQRFDYCRRTAPIGDMSVVFKQMKILEQVSDVKEMVIDLFNQLEATTKKKNTLSEVKNDER